MTIPEAPFNTIFGFPASRFFQRGAIRPRIEAFRNYLKYIYSIDKHVHLIEMSIDKFNSKWLLTIGVEMF